MRYSDITGLLLEGVKFGKRELDEVLNANGDFRMGIEYEFHANNKDKGAMTDIHYVQKILDEERLEHIARVESEHDSMVEVVTDTIPSLVEGFNNIKRFFEIADKHDFTFPKMAGLHVSISHKDNSKPVNLVKFLVLLSGDYLHSLFPERQYVKNIADVMRQAIKHERDHSRLTLDSTTAVEELEAIIERKLVHDTTSSTKYVTAKVSDYLHSDGRIELRFSGGENYNKQYDQIRYQVIRACFILGIAFDDRVYRKEYIKSLYKLVPDALTKTEKIEMDVIEGRLHTDDIVPARLNALIKNTQNPEFLLKVFEQTKQRYPEKEHILLVENWSIMEALILTVGGWLDVYIEEEGKPWRELEEFIAATASSNDEVNLFDEYADLYIKVLLRNGFKGYRIPAFEKAYIENEYYFALSIYMSTLEILDWEEGIEHILKVPRAAVNYASEVGIRIPQLEELFINDPSLLSEAIGYVEDVIDDRFPVIEDVILEHGRLEHIAEYMRVGIKDYWTEGAKAVTNIINDIPPYGIKRRAFMFDYIEFLRDAYSVASDPEQVYQDILDGYVKPMIAKYKDERDERRAKELATFAMNTIKELHRSKYKKLLMLLDQEGVLDD